MNGFNRQQSPCSGDGVGGRRAYLDAKGAASCPFSDQLVTKIPVLESYSTFTNTFHIRMASHPVLSEMATGSDRIWFSRQAVQVAPNEQNFSSFVKRVDALSAPALVIHSRRELMGEEAQTKGDDPFAAASEIDQLSACTRVPIRLTKYDPEELTFNCTSPDDGWLMVTDRWAPGWRAEVNGDPTELFIGDFIFRAVRVRAGENSVRFTYHPPLFPWLLIVSWGTLGGIAISTGFRFVRGRRVRSN
jgi:hypothetical protein